MWFFPFSDVLFLSQRMFKKKFSPFSKLMVFHFRHPLEYLFNFSASCFVVKEKHSLTVCQRLCPPVRAQDSWLVMSST